jgi:hypothetical protein
MTYVDGHYHSDEEVQPGSIQEAFSAASKRLREAEIAANAEAAAIAATRHALAPCELNIPDVPAPEGTGHLYVLQFSTGAIKVGQTADLRKRLAEHRRDASAFNVVITGYWVSLAHAEYLSNEKKLIAYCGTIGRRAKNEYFHGADLATVRQFAVELTSTAGGSGDVQ